MAALYIILGIVLLFVVLFSMRVTLIVDYAEKTVVIVKYLFLKFTVFDSSKPKSEKKPKKPKKGEKDHGEAKAEATATESTEASSDIATTAEKGKGKKEKAKGNSLFKQIYLDHGYDGIVRMLNAIKSSLGGFFGKLYKTVVFDELYITMVTAGSDAADTAIKHGKLCAWAYPILGKLVSTCKVKQYDFDFSPDFLATKNQASAYVRLHVTPIHITNAAVVLALQLVFKVLFKILFSKKKSDKSKVIIAEKSAKAEETAQNTNNTININKDGASK